MSSPLPERSFGYFTGSRHFRADHLTSIHPVLSNCLMKCCLPKMAHIIRGPLKTYLVHFQSMKLNREKECDQNAIFSIWHVHNWVTKRGNHFQQIKVIIHAKHRSRGLNSWQNSQQVVGMGLRESVVLWSVLSLFKISTVACLFLFTTVESSSSLDRKLCGLGTPFQGPWTAALKQEALGDGLIVFRSLNKCLLGRSRTAVCAAESSPAGLNRPSS